MDKLHWILQKLRDETGREDITWIEARHGLWAVHFEIAASGKHYLVSVGMPFIYEGEDRIASVAVEMLKATLESEERNVS